MASSRRRSRGGCRHPSRRKYPSGVGPFGGGDPPGNPHVLAQCRGLLRGTSGRDSLGIPVPPGRGCRSGGVPHWGSVPGRAPPPAAGPDWIGIRSDPNPAAGGDRGTRGPQQHRQFVERSSPPLETAPAVRIRFSSQSGSTCRCCNSDPPRGRLRWRRPSGQTCSPPV